MLALPTQLTPVQGLLARLEVVAPAWIERGLLRSLVTEALHELPDPDLREALDCLEHGTSPDAPCERFLYAWRFRLEGLACGSEFEDALYTLAEHLLEWEWRTPAYQALEQGVSRALDGDLDALARELEASQALLEAAWEHYASTPVAPNHVTAESVVGHQLLARGIASLGDALASLEQADYEGGLQAAEQGCRLLAVVAKLHERLAVVCDPMAVQLWM